MYKRYVDDINVIVGAVEPGAKIAGGMLTIDEEFKAQDSIEIKMKYAWSCRRNLETEYTILYK